MNSDTLVFGLEFGTIIQLAGLLLLLRYVIDTYRTVRANTYFQVMAEINGHKNLEEVDKLKEIIATKKLSTESMSGWEAQEIGIARSITNRYQIVAHLVERNFLSKTLFLENFSGTMMDVWNLTAAFIQSRRSAFNNSPYLRRDLERLALQCWLYQSSIGFASPLKLLDKKNQLTENVPAKKSIVKRLILRKRREPFMLSWLKTSMRSFGI